MASSNRAASFRTTPRLAISVFNAEEVRAAVAGGADIIDCEDPKQSLGMFAPRVITDICYAVRQTTSDAIPTSANIGIPLLVKGPDATKSVIRTAAEIEAKAAQEALGLAAAMDVGDGRSNIIKFEVDGLREEDVRPFVEAVKNAIRHSRQFQNHRVIASCLELDRAAWKARRANRDVISELLLVGEFYFDREGPIDLHDYSDIIDPHKLMDGRSEHSKVSLIEPSEPVSLGLPADADERLEFYVETLADAHVDGVMIDTPIQRRSRASPSCRIVVPQGRRPTRGRRRLRFGSSSDLPRPAHSDQSNVGWPGRSRPITRRSSAASWTWMSSCAAAQRRRRSGHRPVHRKRDIVPRRESPLSWSQSYDGGWGRRPDGDYDGDRRADHNC